MRAVVFVTLTCFVSALCLGNEYWWISDYSDPNAIRHVDYRPASKIEIAAGLVRLQKEQDGKLVPYFESKSPDTARQILAQMGYEADASAPTYIPAEGGFYVNLQQVVSVEYRKSAGAEICILRGLSSEFGRVSDPKTTERIRSKLKE